MSTSDVDRESIRYPKLDDQGNEDGDSLLDMYKQNFYPGALDYMPIENIEDCDIDDEKCKEEVNEFINKPEALTELCDIEDRTCVEEINEFIATPFSLDLVDREGEIDIIIPEGSDSYYFKRDPMFQYIQDEDIKEIYKRIQSSLINKGPEIVSGFGQIFQLNLTPSPNQVGDPNFIKYYTVDLKNGPGSCTLAFERDKNNNVKVPKADVVFHISEANFVKLYNGRKKTAINYVL